jgi:type II secretion system protein G
MQKILKHGFTLIELLVVISVIGILTALITTNFVEARNRAHDTRAKTNLAQLKIALHSFYINYQRYPETDIGVYLKGCGPTGIDRCTTSFTAGDVIYLDKLPKTGNFNDFFYYGCTDGDDFRVKVTLKNASDADLAESQANCPASSCGGVSPYGTLDYVVCGSQ